MVGDLLSQPGTAVAASLICPFAVRFYVAWTVFQRVRGWPPATTNLPPRRIRSDYPRPNDPLVEGLVFAGAVVVSGLVVVLFSLLDPNETLRSWVWSGLFFGSALVSVTWAFRRIRADDRRARQRLAERMAISEPRER